MPVKLGESACRNTDCLAAQNSWKMALNAGMLANANYAIRKSASIGAEIHARGGKYIVCLRVNELKNLRY